jgi:hypothetical protein
MISENSHQLSVILMNFHVRGEVGVQAGLIRRAKAKDEVAFEVSLVVQMRGGISDQIKPKSGHVIQISFVDDQVCASEELLLPVYLRVEKWR